MKKLLPIITIASLLIITSLALPTISSSSVVASFLIFIAESLGMAIMAVYIAELLNSQWAN